MVSLLNIQPKVKPDLFLIVSLLLALNFSSNAQTFDDVDSFKDYYPIAKRPYFSGGIGNNPYERIIFDAKPFVYYGLYNNIRESLLMDSTSYGDAVYITMQPHLRLYDENSKPVKTPSYKVLIGWQHILSTSGKNFLTIAIESGHYSNGQSGAAFSSKYQDGSEEGNSIYEYIDRDTDLSAILNRTSGNFSTNLSRISFNYRLNTFDSFSKPNTINSFTISYQLYHNRFLGLFSFGGYNKNDIKLYGRHHLEIGYSYTSYLKKWRFSLEQNLYIQFSSHPSTNAIRTESRILTYPWDSDFGFFTEFSYGFDDYNYRFVDSFSRLSIGITWDWFKPFMINTKSPN